MYELIYDPPGGWNFDITAEAYIETRMQLGLYVGFLIRFITTWTNIVMNWDPLYQGNLI